MITELVFFPALVRVSGLKHPLHTVPSLMQADVSLNSSVLEDVMTHVLKSLSVHKWCYYLLCIV